MTLFFQVRIKRGSMPKCKPLGQFYFDRLKTSQVEKFCRRMLKKSWDFFWLKIMYLRVSGNFYEVDSILERVNKKTVKTILFYTRFGVYNFSQATLIISVGFCNFFWYTYLRPNQDSLAFPHPFDFTETCKLV